MCLTGVLLMRICVSISALRRIAFLLWDWPGVSSAADVLRRHTLIHKFTRGTNTTTHTRFPRQVRPSFRYGLWLTLNRSFDGSTEMSGQGSTLDVQYTSRNWIFVLPCFYTKASPQLRCGAVLSKCGSKNKVLAKQWPTNVFSEITASESDSLNY